MPETLAPSAPQAALEQDAVLSEQERQAANQMELRHQLENPDELRVLRNAVTDKRDEEARAIIKQFGAFKMLTLEGQESVDNVSVLQEKYGDDVVSNITDTYMEYLTMPDDKFDAWAESASKPAATEPEEFVLPEPQALENSAELEAEKAKLRFKYGENTAKAMGEDMLQKEAERNLGITKAAEKTPEPEVIQTPDAAPEDEQIKEAAANVQRKIMTSEEAQKAFAERGEAAYTEYIENELATNPKLQKLQDRAAYNAGEAVSGQSPIEVAGAELKQLTETTGEDIKSTTFDAYNDSIRLFEEKVDAKLYDGAELSIDEYTRLVNNLVDSFNKFADANGLDQEERDKRLKAIEQFVDTHKASLDSLDQNTGAPAESTQTPEQAEDKKRFKALRRRIDNLKTRGFALATGDLRTAFGSMENGKEGKLATKRRVIGAAALVGVGIMAYANHKNGWGIDINPFDGDLFDLNPTNNGEVAAEAVPAPTPEVQTAPELVNVQIAPGEGTSHIAKNMLGVDFDTVDQWNQFNAQTNSLFAGLEGFYQDAATGEWRISGTGNRQIPQSILEQMQKVAEQVKASA